MRSEQHFEKATVAAPPRRHSFDVSATGRATETDTEHENDVDNCGVALGLPPFPARRAQSFGDASGMAMFAMNSPTEFDSVRKLPSKVYPHQSLANAFARNLLSRAVLLDHFVHTRKRALLYACLEQPMDSSASQALDDWLRARSPTLEDLAAVLARLEADTLARRLGIYNLYCRKVEESERRDDDPSPLPVFRRTFL